MPPNTAFCQHKVTKTLAMAQVLSHCCSLVDSVECLAVLQEEEAALAKADKIKLALEKLKEAKVKKVNYESLLHGAVKLMTFMLNGKKKKNLKFLVVFSK